ncbi:hypothetical protein NE619_19015, partial [Anaerovorax odorimutans]|nr:hypothetical protein [Anaerovorax odorimutans]
FIELKAPGKKPTPLQMKKMRELHGLGFITGWADSKESVDQFLDRMQIVGDAVLMDILEAGGQL